MMLGLLAIMTGRKLPLGTDIDIVVSTYENGMYEGLTPIIVEGELKVLKESMLTGSHASNIVLLQTLFLVSSTVGLMMMEMGI